MTATVFISYAHADQGIVSPYARTLAGAHFAVFYDVDSIDAGENWRTSVDAALTKTAKDGYFVQFLSTAALASVWTDYELQTFRQMQRDSARCIFIEIEPIDELVLSHLQGLQRLVFYGRRIATNEQKLLEAVAVD